MSFTIKRNDTRPLLILNLIENGSPLDLTDADSVRAILKAGAVVVEPAAAVTNAATGEVTVTFEAADTSTAGTFNLEVEITWAAGEIETVPNEGYAEIIIAEDLG